VQDLSSDHPEDALGIIDGMSEPSFVLIIEDHPLYKQALMSLLRLSFPENNIAAYNQAEEAYEFLTAQTAEVKARSVALLDLSLPGLSGLELIAKIHSEHPELQIAAISGSDDAMRVGACLGAGVRAFISKNTPPDRIVDLIGRALRKGLSEQVWLTIDGQKNLSEVTRIHLTARQLEVLSLVCKGYSNKQIADHTHTVEATAKAHVSAILRELVVENRTQALLVAQKLGFKE
jgi:DNA-binding NarL/FixJ family response regulator